MASTSHLSDVDVVPLLQALGEPTRLGIVRMLAGGERCVCELQDDLDAGQSRLSFHLKKLREAGLVADRREGRWVHYRLVPEALAALEATLAALRDGSDQGWRGSAPSCCD